ncbi:TonB-dependent receptor [Mucilaginibacter sp. BJC16-A38]|uniref:SusC/RagA family TonB-linked outer membrane protein n=1 Tax=Mucilaginibacter phenanthrenivorans TaxID=1234842 RepID=UPI002157E4D7|nr:TonB-dependent receptor [Mucilaginibacter phenanthrenivorans]MCR8559400.1 TonB-dependent receptor [Mucilaginibacter phenanthrenivorans]
MKFKLKPVAIWPGMSKIFLAMKLIAVLLFIALSQAHADSYAQTISIHENNVPVEKILLKIEKQTAYHFIYDSKLEILKTKSVSIDADNATITSVLDKCLGGLPVSYTIIQQTIALKSNDAANTAVIVQALKVSGQVTDEKGIPLPGVTVKLKGSALAVPSDVSGNYSITIPDPNGTLVFSFVSYETQEIKVNGNSTINVQLKPGNNKLNEVVVVGYGTQSKAKVSGAITTVVAKEVALSPSPNLGAGLAGRIPGVVINDRGGEPGNDGVSVYIRGISTSGSASPLIVIDGIVRDYGAMNYIPPADVESITVLKDASAAIYGSRAANGVILITTKHGKLGKAAINATYNQAWMQPQRIPESANASLYASMVNLENELRGLPDTYSANDLALYQNGSDPLNHPNTSWQKLTLANWQHQERADVDATGGTEGVKYYFGAGYLHDGTPFVNGFTYDKQYHFISNIDAQISKDLKVSLNLSGRVRNNVSSLMDWAHVFLGLPVLNGIYPNGLIGPGRTGNNAVLMASNPNYGFYQQNAGNFTSTASVEYKIPGVDGLVVSGNFAYDYDNNYNKTWKGVTYYYILDPATGQYNKMQNSNTASPNLLATFPAGNSVTSNIKLGYTHTFASVHAIDAFIGYEQNTTSSTFISAGRNNYASGTIQEIFAGDSNTANQSNNGRSSRTGRENLFGRALYTYNDKYNVQFQFRYDGSDNFAPGKRYGFFPGVSGNWIASKESFLKDVKWIDNLKLRASWGELGNDNVGAYQYLTSYQYGSNYPFNSTTNQGLVQANAPNPNITWEVAKTTDIGIDSRFFNGALTATIDVFRTNRSNILAPRNASVPAYTGLTLPFENIGRIKNQGIELDLSTSGHVGGFTYTIEGNFTYAKNTVLFQDETPGTPSYQRATGASLGTVVLYETNGIYKSQDQINSTPHLAGVVPGDLIYVDTNHDGVVNSLDQVRQKYGPTPNIVYGTNFTFGYKNFELNLGFQGQGQAYGEKYSVLPFDPVGWGDFPSAMAKNAWSPSNPNGTNPAPGQNFTNGTTNTTWRYASMAFLKLKTAEFSYTFDSKSLNKIGVKGAKVFLNGTNLFFIHDNFKDINLDPEQTNWGWGMDQLRVINLGINFTL